MQSQTTEEMFASDTSPDGRWVAFVSNSSGVSEIYVQPFPGPGGPLQVSTKGGDQPEWRPDGAGVSQNARANSERSGAQTLLQQPRSIVMFDRTGKTVGEIASAATYYGFRLSPNGKLLAVDRLFIHQLDVPGTRLLRV